MANIAYTGGVRSATSALAQEYLSRSIVSYLFSMLPLLAMMIGAEGDKNGLLGIGIPNTTKIQGRVVQAKHLVAGASTSARAREKEIYSAPMYQPLIHASTFSALDNASGIPVGAPGMPVVGGQGALIPPVFQAFMQGPATSQGVGTITIVSSGVGISGTSGSLTFNSASGGGAGSSFAASCTISSGGVTAVAIGATGSGFLSAPVITLSSGGTPMDQHFQRPFTRWYEIITPVAINKTNMDYVRNLAHTASKNDAEKALTDIVAEGVKDARGVHLTQIAQELWGVNSATGLPSNQNNQEWDHLLSVTASMSSSNTYAGVDRTLSANSYYLGNTYTSNAAASVVSLYNIAYYNYGIGKLGISDGRLVCFAGPSIFPQLFEQARSQSGFVMYDKAPPEHYEFAAAGKIFKYQDMWVVFDPTLPDKLNISPVTGVAYTANYTAILNLESFVFGFMPGRKFNVDPIVDLSHINGPDQMVTRIRTKMFVINEAPPASVLFTNVN